MKVVLLLCFMSAFAFAVQDEEKAIHLQTPYLTPNPPDDANPEVSPIVRQLIQARNNGDWTAYKELLGLYASQMPIPQTYNGERRLIVREDNSAMRWNGDRTIYSGRLDDWNWVLDDESFSVDHVRGDTLRAAVASADSTIKVFQSNNRGNTWYWVATWRQWDHILREPEIINDPGGRFYHVAARSDSNDGDILVFTDSTPGSWYYRTVGIAEDVIENYSMCSDRAQYDGNYCLFLMYEKDLGGQGLNEICFTRSFDWGNTWENAFSLQIAGSRKPDITFGDNNYLYQTRIWDNSNDSQYVRIRVSSDEGVTWDYSVTIQTDTLRKMAPQIAAAHDGSGDLWVTWPRSSWYNVFDWNLLYAWSQDNGSSWSYPGFISGSDTLKEFAPSITIYDANGNYYPYLAWIETDTLYRNRSVRMSYWETNNSWAPETSYNDFTPGLLRPCQTWECDGIAAVAYAGDSGVNLYFDFWSNTGIKEGRIQLVPPKVYLLNRPNPFRTNTLIEYNVPADGRIILKIYNSLGAEIVNLVDEYKRAGTYTFKWNGLALPKGVYFARQQVGALSVTRKIIVQ